MIGQRTALLISVVLIAACVAGVLMTRHFQPTLTPVLTAEVTVIPGEEASVSFEAKANVDHLVMLDDRPDSPQALRDGYIKLFNDGEALPSIENHYSDIQDAPATFAVSNEDTKITVKIGSDTRSEGGTATLHVYDSSHLKDPVVFLEGDIHSDGPGEPEISLCVRRFGDVSVPYDYRIALSDFPVEVTVPFEAKRSLFCASLPEGAPLTGTATLSNLSRESKANAKLLNLPLEIDLTELHSG